MDPSNISQYASFRDNSRYFPITQKPNYRKDNRGFRNTPPIPSNNGNNPDRSQSINNNTIYAKIRKPNVFKYPYNKLLFQQQCSPNAQQYSSNIQFYQNTQFNGYQQRAYHGNEKKEENSSDTSSEEIQTTDMPSNFAGHDEYGNQLYYMEHASQNEEEFVEQMTHES